MGAEGVTHKKTHYFIVKINVLEAIVKKNNQSSRFFNINVHTWFLYCQTEYFKSDSIKRVSNVIILCQHLLVFLTKFGSAFVLASNAVQQ